MTGEATTLTGRAAPTVSVIVPVRNDPGNLRQCLRCLRQSTFTDHELIVVDDASTDDTARVAEELGAQVIRLAERGGPGRARNHGAKVARGEYLFFIDADCCAQEQTIERIVRHFRDDPGLDALFGSYDDRPAAPNVLSQWRNLLHHYTHQQGGERACTFWAGCGAMKRELFLSAGGFDVEAYTRPCIEDIELGVRLFRGGHKLAITKDVQVKHLKRWTWRGMIRTDVRDRGIPWTRLILRERNLPNDLNLKTGQRVAALLSALLVAVVVVGAWWHPTLLLAPAVALGGVAAIDRWTYRRPVPAAVRVAGTALALAGVVAGAWYWRGWMAVAAGIVLGIVLINLHFYRFFARTKGPLFAALIVPLHILYYLYSGLSLAVGIGLHVWNRRAVTVSGAAPVGSAAKAP